MIELRIDQYQLEKATNDLIYQQHILNALRQAGVPVVGVLVIRSVSRGKLVMHIEQDIDGDTFIWRWYPPEETIHVTNVQGYKPVKKGSGPAYEWTEFKPFGVTQFTPPLEADDESF